MVLKKNTEALFWILFLFSIILEFLLFKSFILREVVNYYPSNYDQLQYLSQSYTLYENELTQGPFAIIHYMLHEIAPQTLLLPLEAVFFFLLFGASRYSALLLNIGYFLVLQIFIVLALRKVSKNYSTAFVFLGLLLSTQFPFFWAGGLVDFRVDFIATCLYGIFIASVIKSDFFLEKTWSVVSLLITIILILTRTITIFYIIPIFTLMLLYFLYCFKKNETHAHIQKCKIRIKNILLSLASITIFSTIYIWLNRVVFYNYYVVGHITGAEKHIREVENNTTNILSTIKYYPLSLLKDQIGMMTFILMSIFLTIFLVAFFIRKIPATYIRERNEASNISFKNYYVFILITILVPFSVLNMDSSKSPVVADIMVIPILWLFIVAYIQFYSKINRYVALVIATICMVMGLYNWVDHLGTHSNFYYRNNISNLNKMYIDIGNYLQDTMQPVAILSTDQISDSINCGVLNIVYYENKNILLNAQCTKLGGQLFAITSAEAIAELQRSNIFIAKIDQNTTDSIYPFEQSIASIDVTLLKQAERDFLLLGNYHFDNTDYRVYVKPNFEINEISGDWITSQGFTVIIPKIVVEHTKAIKMLGVSNFNWITPKLKVFATTVINNQSIELNPVFTVNGQNYEIYCPLPANIRNEQDLKIKFKFSDYFIPEKLGINNDTRELVIMVPQARQVILK